MKKILLTSIAALSLLVVLGCCEYSLCQKKVVYHVNCFDVKRSIGAMRNAQNHINVLGEGNHEIRFVLHGNGVELLKKVPHESTDAANRIDSLRSQGVKFKIYANVKGQKNRTWRLAFCTAS